MLYWEAQWPSGRASYSEVTGWGFNPRSGHRVVSLSKIHLLPKSTCHTLEAGLRPDMTTGMLSKNETMLYSLFLEERKTSIEFDRVSLYCRQ